MRKCKTCGEEKEITEFVKGKGELYRYKCKACRQKGRRTGLISNTRFQKGQKPIGVTFQKGHTPWHKGLTNAWRKENGSISKHGSKSRHWCEDVKVRDINKCVRCGSTERVSAHHIKPWKDFPELRFDVNNGISLCGACHAKEEGFQKGSIPWNEGKKCKTSWNKGIKISEEQRKRLSDLRKRMPSPMKGKKHSEETRKKMSLAKLGKSCKNGFKKQNEPWNKGINLSTT